MLNTIFIQKIDLTFGFKQFQDLDEPRRPFDLNMSTRHLKWKWNCVRGFFRHFRPPVKAINVWIGPGAITLGPICFLGKGFIPDRTCADTANGPMPPGAGNPVWRGFSDCILQ
jgi:hypothetical protein